MSSYSLIADCFARAGYNDLSLLDQSTINTTLDQIIYTNLQVPQFDRTVSEQMFQQTFKNNQGKVLLRDYIGVILKAHDILQKNIKKLREQYKNESDEDTKNDLLSQMFQFQQDLKLLTLPFKIQGPIKVPELQGYVDKDNNRSRTERTLNVEQPVQIKKQESKTLAVLFVLVFIWFVMELVCSLGRYNFMNILAASSIMSMAILNIFDKVYIRINAAAILVTMLLDLIWLIVMKNYLNPTTFNLNFNVSSGFLGFVFIATIVFMVLRVVCLGLLYPYLNNPAEELVVVRFGKSSIELSGSTYNNPLRHLFSRQVEVSGIEQ